MEDETKMSLLDNLDKKRRPASSVGVRSLMAEKFMLYAVNTKTGKEFPGLLANAQIRVQEDAKMFDTLIYFLTTWVLDGHRVVRREQDPVLFPSTPWQFFKQRYMPAWFVERFPVEYDKTHVTVAEHHHYICPHLVTDERHDHIMFMYEGVNGKTEESGVEGTPGASS